MGPYMSLAVWRMEGAGPYVSHLCEVWGEIRPYVATSMGAGQPGHWCPYLFIRVQGEMGYMSPSTQET